MLETAGLMMWYIKIILEIVIRVDEGTSRLSHDMFVVCLVGSVLTGQSGKSKCDQGLTVAQQSQLCLKKPSSDELTLLPFPCTSSFSRHTQGSLQSAARAPKRWTFCLIFCGLSLGSGALAPVFFARVSDSVWFAVDCSRAGPFRNNILCGI